MGKPGNLLARDALRQSQTLSDGEMDSHAGMDLALTHVTPALEHLTSVCPANGTSLGRNVFRR